MFLSPYLGFTRAMLRQSINLDCACTSAKQPSLEPWPVLWGGRSQQRNIALSAPASGAAAAAAASKSCPAADCAAHRAI